MRTGRSRSRSGALPLSIIAASVSGCGLLETTAEMPGRVASAATESDTKPPPIDPIVLQARVMRFADVFAVEISRGTREFAEITGTPEGRIQALTWKIDYANWVWRLAAGPQPFVALFDSIVTVSFLRSIHEELWLPEWGEADRPILDSLVRLEESAWALAKESLTDAQYEQVRTIISTWLADDSANLVADMTKLPSYFDLTSSEEDSETSLFRELTGLMRIDPLSGLDPAVREVAQARQLAERVFFYVQRMPELLSSRVELLAQRSAETPQVRGPLESVDRVSQAVASIAATAEALPANFRAEREAALAQISAELTAQREGLIRDLEAAREPLTEILEGTRSTAEATRSLSEALTVTLQTADSFVGRFVSKEDDAGGAPVPADAPAEPAGESAAEPAGRPFDINEYGAAAEQIGVAVRELGETIATLDRSLPQVQRVLEEAGARADRSVDHVLVRALQFLAAAIAGSAIAVLLVRWISLRWRQAGARPTAN